MHLESKNQTIFQPNWFINTPVVNRSNAKCLLAVGQDGLLLQHVPPPHRTFEVCIAAVRQNWRALKYTPEQLMIQNDYEICLTAFEQNTRAIYYLPEAVRSDDLFIRLLNLDPHAFVHFPKEKRCLKFSEHASKLDSSIFHYIPNLIRTPSMKHAADSSISTAIYNLMGEHAPTQLDPI